MSDAQQPAAGTDASPQSAPAPPDSVADLLERGTLAQPERPRRVVRFVARPEPGRAVAAEAALVALFAPEPVVVAPLSPLDPGVLVATLPRRMLAADPTAAFALAQRIADLPEVAEAEPDLPTDLFPEREPRRDADGRESFDDFPPGCWAGEDAALKDDPLWALRLIRADRAWARSEEEGRRSRGEGVIVAQPDTGVARHRELDVERRVASFDVLDGDDEPEDPLTHGGQTGHGTATGSVVVSGEDGVMAGSAPRALHMPIRCIETVVRLSQVNVARAMDCAVEGGAAIVTMSLGGIPSFPLRRALARAVAADVIVLAAAGNCVGLVVWPARYDLCIAVAGVDRHMRPWRGSCSGTSVDVSAPAENVFRARVTGTDPDVEGTEVGQGEGTSFAVALTAGVAALWLAHHGRANLIAEARARGETLQAMLRRLLRATARRPADWDATEYGAGVVDAEALLDADFDLGRGREGALVRFEDPDFPVRSLVAEHLGAAAVDHALDYRRHGQELALHVLEDARNRRGAARGARRDESAPGRGAHASSPDLLDAVHNERLRAWLAVRG